LINGDRDYYKSFTLELYAQLFGINIQNAEIPVQTDSNQIQENQIGVTIIGNIGHIEPKTTKQAQVISAINQALTLEDAVQSPKAFMYIFDSLPNIKRTKAYKALESADFEHDTGHYTPEEFRSRIYRIIGSDALKGHKQKVDAAIELEAKRQDPEAFLKILDNFLNPKDSAYKKIVLLIEKGTQKEKTDDEIPLFSMQNDFRTNTFRKSSLFISDNHCWDFLKSLVPEKLHKEVYKDLIWFQDEYEKGDSSQYYARASRENYATIEAFIRYIGKKKYANALNIQSIADYLRQIYVR